MPAGRRCRSSRRRDHSLTRRTGAAGLLGKCQFYCCIVYFTWKKFLRIFICLLGKKGERISVCSHGGRGEIRTASLRCLVGRCDLNVMSKLNLCI